VERRLAAILAADVVGYSRLMGADEAGTLAALKAHREELIDRKIADHRGRLVKLTGDGILVEFPSVVNAVSCAADIQRNMQQRNADVPEDRRIAFRVGVNLGDVIVEGDDIFGDGVNVAARLESLAAPGGIVISSTVRDHIGNRLELSFEDLGQQTLKNIEHPVRVYGVAFAGSPVRPLPSKPSAAKDKPSIAVLPFANLSGDAEQEYFADGITEDLITDLSKVSGLSVIARNSVFTYKGTHADVQEVSRRFKVSNVLEGSVRKAGQRVRINAQLIDGRDGTHLWADRYDRDLTDIFAIQDEITKAIVEQLKVRLLVQEKRAIEAAPTQNIDAYNYYLQGRHLYHLHHEPHVVLAQRMFRKAVELDPTYARAYAGLADCAWFLYNENYGGTTVDDIFEPSAKALELDPTLPEAHASYGIALHYRGERAKAIAAFERALALDPNCFEALYLYAYAASDAGDPETSVRLDKRAVELDPDDYRVLPILSQTLAALGRIEESNEAAREAVRRAERALIRQPDVPLAATLGAGSLIRLGDYERAREWMARALMIAPDNPLTLYNVACDHALLGEVDRALELLERWKPRASTHSKDWVRSDTDFDGIRDDPRFQEFLKHLG
jgi:adenylate cyclase